MTNEAPRPPDFRLRFLLEPEYLGRKLREIRSFDDFLGRTINLVRYGRGLLAGVRRGKASTPAAAFSAEIRRPETPARTAALAEQFSAARPFKHLVIDDFFLPEFCRRLSAEFPAYDGALFYDEQQRPGMARHEGIAGLGPAYAELDRCLQSSEFLELVSRITGIPGLQCDADYAGGGTHEYLEGMELDPHVDFTLHPKSGLIRRVNLILHLNPEWDESWGGALELHLDPRLPPARNAVRTILPLFNRCVIFETGDRSWYGFEAVKPPPGKKGLSRRSIAASFYTREDRRGILPIPRDLAVFADRPLPPEIKPGRTLTEEDMRLISRRIAARDWKLEYLYRRAIGLFNQWRAVKEELEKTRPAPAAAASPETAPSEGRGAKSP